MSHATLGGMDVPAHVVLIAVHAHYLRVPWCAAGCNFAEWVIVKGA